MTRCCSPPPAEDPAERHVYAGGPGGTARLTREPGVHHAARQGNLMVYLVPVARLVRPASAGLARRPADREDPVAGGDPGARPGGDVPDRLERMSCRARCCCPRGHRRGSARLPVLCDPYGGPAAQRVVSFAQRLPDLAVVRRPGLRRADRRRPGHAGSRARLGPAGPLRRGHAEPRGPGGGAARGRRGAPRPGPEPGRHPRLVPRRLPWPRSPCCGGRTSSTRRWPERR